jgi:hypothetical protein
MNIQNMPLEGLFPGAENKCCLKKGITMEQLQKWISAWKTKSRMK